MVKHPFLNKIFVDRNVAGVFLPLRAVSNPVRRGVRDFQPWPLAGNRERGYYFNRFAKPGET